MLQIIKAEFILAHNTEKSTQVTAEIDQVLNTQLTIHTSIQLYMLLLLLLL